MPYAARPCSRSIPKGRSRKIRVGRYPSSTGRPVTPARLSHGQAAPPAGGFELLGERGRGHFVGMFLVAQGAGENANPLDAAASFFNDGAKTARREGLLAYFNGTKDRPQFAEVGPTTGFPIITKGDDGGRRLGAYRWHLTDPIVFARSLDAKLGHNNVAKAAAAIRGAAFWYSEHPGPARAGD